MRTLLSALALVASMSLMAQNADHDDDKKTPEEKGKHRTEVMTKELGLNADQQAKVLEINTNFAKSMVSVKQLQREEDRKMRGDVLKQKRDERLRVVLTPEQYNKMVELRDKKKEDKKETHKE
jgi:periplasmic protein CpxP/Spy